MQAKQLYQPYFQANNFENRQSGLNLDKNLSSSVFNNPYRNNQAVEKPNQPAAEKESYELVNVNSNPNSSDESLTKLLADLKKTNNN